MEEQVKQGHNGMDINCESMFRAAKTVSYPGETAMLAVVQSHAEPQDSHNGMLVHVSFTSIFDARQPRREGSIMHL
jgi:hypothetical protein